MRHLLMMTTMLLAQLSLGAQTLDECRRAAEDNYPLIRRYGLIERTTQLTTDIIAKGWLPQVSATAQATLQSDVTAWPAEMQTMMQQMGIGVEGLKRDQYRVGIDVQQTLYDGGAMSSRRAVAQRQGEVEAARTEATVYQVRRRVGEMYFALLLLDQQMRQNEDLQAVLSANERKLAAMLKGGTAAESDYNSVKAERLGAAQQLAALQSQRQAVARMLSAFCGMEVSAPVMPVGLAEPSAQTPGQRPELKAIDAQLRLADAEEHALSAALKPRLGLFAQGFYGYPGLNMFDDMMHHRWSLGGIVGARLTWNIGALYTRKADRLKLQAQRDMAETERDVFLFNNHLEQIEQSESIARYRQLMAADDEIIALRTAVRQAAESKLAHGIIDVNDLVREINSESAAKVQRAVHEIEMLKEMYNLKCTTNN